MTMMTSEARSDRNYARVLVAACIGNALEWFDFVIYGYLAVIMSRLFFPSDDATVALLMAMGTFALGFLMRPLGGVLIGLYADRFGRRAALSGTMWLMALGTGIIAFAPIYAQIGIAAPFLILFARLIQGFAASGEYGSAVAMLAESAPPGRRALFVSCQMASTMLAVVIAGTIGFFAVRILSDQQMLDWGWRVPFLVGLLVAPVGYYIRRHIDETIDVAEAKRHRATDTLKQLLGAERRKVLIALGVQFLGTGNFYVTFLYMPTFAVGVLKLGLDAPFLSTCVAGVVGAGGVLFFASMVDRGFAPQKMLALAAAALLILAMPLYSWVIAAPSVERLLLVQLILVVPGSCITALTTIVSSSLFRPALRASGLGLVYNVSSVLFGGLAPLTVTWLTATFGGTASAAYYLMTVAVIGLVALAPLLRRKWDGWPRAEQSPRTAMDTEPPVKLLASRSSR